MPVTSFNQIKPGLVVSIVLKADQRTGRQVQGTVAQLLTRHNHPRGIKVKLADGRVGRVQRILVEGSAQNQTRNQIANTKTQQYTMNPNNSNSNNPWADSTSQGNPYHSPTTDDHHQPHQQHQEQQDQTYFSGNNSEPHQNQYQSYQPYQQHDQSSSGHSYNPPPLPPPRTTAQSGSGGIRRSDTATEQVLAADPDRAAQVEHMQQYEAAALETEDDRNQAALQKQFPTLDSSLIAAIYNERKSDLAEVRELLQELSSG